MSQHVRDPLEETQQSVPKPARPGPLRASSISVFALLVVVGLALVLFAAQILANLVPLQTASGKSAFQGSATSDATSAATSSPFARPDGNAISSLQLPASTSLLFQDSDGIFLFSAADRTVQPISAPGYAYTPGVPALLTPAGQLIYSGNEGIWLLSTIKQPVEPTQLAHFEASAMITSLVLSRDGKMLAWTTTSADGTGQTKIYAGPLSRPELIWQQSTAGCPCYRIFSFFSRGGVTPATTLLLTNNRGSNQPIQYGLWSLDITHANSVPRPVMDESPQQGPLVLSPSEDALLYSTYEGVVSPPADNGVPQAMSALSYANSLSLANLNGSPPSLSNSQVLLSEQHNLPDSTQYHWVTTPTFSPSGNTLAYVEFSSDSQPPYTRHSALYLVQFSTSEGQREVGKPALFVTAASDLLEAGPWLNDHVLTLYADGAIYAMDIQSGALATLAQPGKYLRILGTPDN